MTFALFAHPLLSWSTVCLSYDVMTRGLADFASSWVIRSRAVTF